LSCAPAAVGLFPSYVMTIDRTPAFTDSPPCARFARRLAQLARLTSLPPPLGAGESVASSPHFDKSGKVVNARPTRGANDAHLTCEGLCYGLYLENHRFALGFCWCGER